MELASDNLPEQEIALFNQAFNDRGLLAETDPADDWEADVGFAVSDAEYAEIWVGLGNANFSRIENYVELVSEIQNGQVSP